MPNRLLAQHPWKRKARQLRRSREAGKTSNDGSSSSLVSRLFHLFPRRRSSKCEDPHEVARLCQAGQGASGDSGSRPKDMRFLKNDKQHEASGLNNMSTAVELGGSRALLDASGTSNEAMLASSRPSPAERGTNMKHPILKSGMAMPSQPSLIIETDYRRSSGQAQASAPLQPRLTAARLQMIAYRPFSLKEKLIRWVSNLDLEQQAPLDLSEQLRRSKHRPSATTDKDSGLGQSGPLDTSSIPQLDEGAGGNPRPAVTKSQSNSQLQQKDYDRMSPHKQPSVPKNKRPDSPTKKELCRIGQSKQKCLNGAASGPAGLQRSNWKRKTVV